MWLENFAESLWATLHPDSRLNMVPSVLVCCESQQVAKNVTAMQKYTSVVPKKTAKKNSKENPKVNPKCSSFCQSEPKKTAKTPRDHGKANMFVHLRAAAHINVRRELPS